MQDPSAPTSGSSPTSPQRKLPHGGLSAVEVAAERGIGPLSPLGLKVWHGESYPCVSCGELVRRTTLVCENCGQDLSLKMIVKMQAHAGPWYVHEHVRPFPGVTLDRLIRQIQRGVLTATTIVRGPTTYHQWRFAAETPALSKHLGLCWNCQSKVAATDTHCRSCKIELDNPAGEDAPPPTKDATAVEAHIQPVIAPPPPVAPTPVAASTPVAPAAPAAQPPDASDIERIRSALGAAASRANTQRRLPMAPIIVAIVVFAILALLLVVKLRADATAKKHEQNMRATPTPTAVIPEIANTEKPPVEE